MDMNSVDLAHDLRMPLQLICSSARMLVLSRDDPALDADALLSGKEPLTVTGIEAVTKAIAEAANDSFNDHNTKVVIQDGKVVEINRSYNP